MPPLVQCPVLGGTVASFDATAAKKRAGVRAVVDLGEGVAVVADRFPTAKAALDDLAVQWHEGPGASVDDGTIRTALEHAAGIPGAVVQKIGDARSTLARSMAISARYSTQLLAHVTLEPQNCVARVDADGVEVWASTQFPQGAQAIAAEAAGVAPSAFACTPSRSAAASAVASTWTSSGRR
jgi:isoquinoline 1-oxidoreductase beta subunit